MHNALVDSGHVGSLGIIRSYVLRQGRLTRGQSKALELGWSRFGLSADDGLIDPVAIFGNQNPVTLEIGFGMGDSLAQQAIAEPERNFIGVEVHRPGVGHLLKLILQDDLPNLRIFTDDSFLVLSQAIPDQLIERMQLFFPDPWPKKKHHKRRIVKPEFLELLKLKLQVDGLLHIATDWQSYADEIRLLFEGRDDFDSVSTPDRPQTKFERRGLKLGHVITDLAYRLTDAS